MESGHEFDSFSELPPLPQVYHHPTSYPYSDVESLPPFPYSDFAFSDQLGADSSLPLLTHSLLTESTRFDNLSPLPLLTRDFLTESTQFENLFSHVATPFHHLPDLHSFEHTTTAAEEVTNPPPHTKRRRLETPFTISPCSSSKSKSPPRPSSSSHAGISSGRRTRRRNVSDMIRSLEKLMPWERKMSLGTVLEETYKYIMFLQSQIASLRWMPLESIYPARPGVATLLKSLTRQQILQVIANSPGSRNVLCTQGVCVFSYEQLLSVKMMAESTRNL
ncbi:unnamed protein product [Eruca vesicaria subsp. sativa]|uniref:BHLH domain-containing protein n=1 Tax=Eruca vesicaria subsp. sativa TaxID=29727 RepID=A0ABC8LJD4_ERUVS|nr:unnamed protein product [Eruca vesicaria subsp. sativa]